MSTTAHNTIASLSKHKLAAKAATWHIEVFDKTPVNRTEISQDRLDLANKTRRNVFPWRGQFSPELVEVLLSQYASSNAFVLDPFAGVGTTLFEAARKGLPASGVEINPAAVTMAQTVMFVGRSRSEREAAFETAADLIQRRIQVHGPLFLADKQPCSTVDSIVELIRECEDEPLVRNILGNTLIRLLECAKPDDSSLVMGALRQHEAVVMNLPASPALYAVVNGDARSMPVTAGTVDLIVTSPPYINVFNYHQNSRRAMELLGWNILDVARSELGANRKHRANRFLTIIQYCVDMSMVLGEFNRVLKPDGRVIMIMGRESCVRGVSFRNGCLVGALAANAGFELALRQERKFTNKFGELIYEDILHLLPVEKRCSPVGAEPRALAVYLLEDAIGRCAKEDARADIRAAIAAADVVAASPLFIPPGQRNHERIAASTS